MKFIQIIFALLPIPFLFHLYEYNGHLEKQGAPLLFPIFVLFIIIIGIQSRKFRLPSLIGINIVMTMISLVLGHFFIVDDGSWFKPFGRDVAIVFISVIYILGQLIIRWISNALSTDK